MRPFSKILLNGKCGVYSIVYTVNGLKYAGSAIDLYSRLTHHKRALQLNQHENPHLQNSWNLYGEDKFEWDILEFCEPEVRIDHEHLIVTTENLLDRNKGYNLRLPAEVGRPASTRKGVPLPLETRDKIRHTLTGRKPPKAARVALRLFNEQRKEQGVPGPNKGRVFSKEARGNMSKSKKGNPKPETFGPKMSEIQKRVRTNATWMVPPDGLKGKMIPNGKVPELSACGWKPGVQKRKSGPVHPHSSS